MLEFSQELAKQLGQSLVITYAFECGFNKSGLLLPQNPLKLVGILALKRLLEYGLQRGTLRLMLTEAGRGDLRFERVEMAGWQKAAQIRLGNGHFYVFKAGYMHCWLLLFLLSLSVFSL